MARKVTWSSRAKQDRIDILKYWERRNKSKVYPRKLNKLFKEGVKFIQNNPNTGKPTNVQGVRLKIVRDYFMVYEIVDEQIHIHAIWDTRKNPIKLKRIIDK